MAKKVERKKKKILRLGLIQNQRILEERLMRKPEKITIGHDYKKNLMVVPASNLPRTFTLIDWDGKGYYLQFTANMEGRLSRGSGVETLEELRQKGIAKRKGGLYRIRLTPTMRGRVAVGEATVLFQFVTPPPERARPVLPSSMKGGFIAGVGATLWAAILVSALVQVGFVVFLELGDWPEPEDPYLRYQQRFAEIMVDEPEEPDEPDRPDDDEGDQPAEEEEEDDAPEPEPEPQEERSPEEEAMERQEERVDLTERVQDETILSTLTVGESEDSALAGLMNDAGDVDAETAFGSADRVRTDVAAGERYDFGGGGSPDADGLADGEEVSQLGGAEGDVDIQDREPEREVQVVGEMDTSPPEDLTDNLDTEALIRGLRQLESAIEGCYQQYLAQDNTAAGSVRIMLTITERGGRGHISNADVVENTVGGDVGRCISRQMERGRMRIPPPEGGDAMIAIPYHFSPGG